MANKKFPLLVKQDTTKVDDGALGKRLKKRATVTEKKERFITISMWMDTIISLLRSDRGGIPRDIGDNVYIGNNVYVTKNSITSVVQVNEFSARTPIAFSSALIRAVKGKVPECQVDITFKSNPYYVDFTDAGLKNRRDIWERNIQKESPWPEKQKERAARLLYSYDVLKGGISAYKTACFILLRGPNAGVTKRAVKACLGFLRANDIDSKQLKAQLQLLLPYILGSSNMWTEKVKNVPKSITTSFTLAESLSVTQGMNASKGVFLGIDGFNGAPYYLDFRTMSSAKNIYCVGTSGTGKTFLILNWLLSAFVDGYGACIMDIKGNEFVSFVHSCGGKVLSMKPGHTCYINTFKMDPNSVDVGESPGIYFRSNLAVSKQVLKIIADLPREYEQQIDGFLDEFMRAMYLQLGVSQDNPNTWFRTASLTPAEVYRYFKRYLSADVLEVYEKIIDQVQMAFSTYLSPGGSESDIFANEYSISDCLEAPVISFDYGMLNARRLSDVVPFKLRCTFMSLINNEYIRYRKNKGLWTFKILEESQLADDYLLSMYKEELTLRRSQNQVTILLGNAVTSLRGNADATAMFENINMFCVGKVNETARNILVSEFGLEQYQETLRNIADDPDLQHEFLFLNRASRSVAARLSAQVPKDVANSPLFKVVDTEE